MNGTKGGAGEAGREGAVTGLPGAGRLPEQVGESGREEQEEAWWPEVTTGLKDAILATLPRRPHSDSSCLLG